MNITDITDITNAALNTLLGLAPDPTADDVLAAQAEWLAGTGERAAFLDVFNEFNEFNNNADQLTLLLAVAAATGAARTAKPGRFADEIEADRRGDYWEGRILMDDANAGWND